MKRAFSTIELPVRPAKPRDAGVSMMIDWGIPPAAQQDILGLSADFIDLAKVAVGISGLIAEESLIVKIDEYQQSGVEPFPGGMYLELAVTRNQVETYYAECRRVGYRLVEVSDNVVHFDAELRERLRGAESKELLVRLGWPDGEPEEAELRPLRAWLDFYLERYGDRCMDELKLEESTLHDDPSFVLNVLLNYLDLEEVSLDGIEAHEREVRQAAERRVRERLGPLKRLLFGWVLSRARRHIREREGMRLVRTHVFGLVRRMFRGLGDHMARRGVLDHQSDVFWLTTDELFGWVAGTAATEDLRAVAALRRAEQRSFEAGPAPDPRFETFGPVAFGNLYRSAAPPETPEGDVLRGIGCAPGVVRGEARVIAAPSDDLRLSGEILVAERTDPGWVPLYPSVSGILVERGSALSHSAIVARELGIPTVVGIVGLTARVRDGEEVELDGALGTVRIIDESRDAA